MVTRQNHLQADPLLLQVAGALNPLGFSFGLGNCGKQKRCQNCDDGQNDQEFNQRKGRLNSWRRKLHLRNGQLLFGQGGFGKLGLDPGNGVFDGQAVFLAEFVLGGGVFDELIGPANADDGRGHMLFAE